MDHSQSLSSRRSDPVSKAQSIHRVVSPAGEDRYSRAYVVLTVMASIDTCVGRAANDSLSLWIVGTPEEMD